jgi:hypothetical protein
MAIGYAAGKEGPRFHGVGGPTKLNVIIEHFLAVIGN